MQLRCHQSIFQFQELYFRFNFSYFPFLVCNNRYIPHFPLGWHFETSEWNNSFIIFVAFTNLLLAMKQFTLHQYLSQVIHPHLYALF